MTGDAHDSAATVGHDGDEGRTTAPMSEFGWRAVAYGIAILAIGAAVAFGVPLLGTTL